MLSLVIQAHSHHNPFPNLFQLSPLSLPSFYQKNRHYINEYIICLLALSFKHNSIQSFTHQSHGVIIITLPVLHLLSTWWHSRANEAPWSFGPWVNQLDGKLQCFMKLHLAITSKKTACKKFFLHVREGLNELTKYRTNVHFLKNQ